MTYTALYNEDYLAHHGVKGMKWGVHKERAVYFTQKQAIGKKRASGSFMNGSRIAYAKKNRKGVEKQKSYHATLLERHILKKTGVINKDGSITTDEQKKRATAYCDTMKKVAVASAVTAVAVNVGSQYLRMKASGNI